ncbi:Hsp20/alpha crystallin family protein [Desulfocurvus sp. DL9XJH121]
MSNEISKTETALPRHRQPSDIIEREDGFHIFMDMPGVPKEGLVIDLKENELVVSGRSEVLTGGEDKFLELEFGDVDYRRAFKLSDTVDSDGIKAHLDNGVLELFLPKAEKVAPKRIEILAG